MKIKNKWLRLALIALVLLVLIGGTLRQSAEAPDTAETPALTLVTASPEENAPPEESPSIAEDGSYTTRDDVALYLHSYGHLPANFVTKGEARKAGWNGGSLEDYFPGCSIGGDRFGNREGLLPAAPGRVWYECDINTLGASSRGVERIVWSNDGLIYYTGDHYGSFIQLY